MNALEIRKTATGQFQYRVGSNMPWQFGSYEMESTIMQAKGRFSCSEAIDVTELTVEVTNRDGSFSTITMTRDCFQRSQARSTGFSQDTFMGRIVAEAGQPVVSDFDAF